MDNGTGVDGNHAAPGNVGGADLPRIILKDAAGNAPLAASELLDADSRDVRAETVLMERSGAEAITAERVSIVESGARSIEARSAQVDRSGVLALTGQQVVLQDSSAVSVTADEVRLVKGFAVFVRAEKVSLDGESRTIVMDGEGIRPVVGVAGAAAFGAGLGLVLLLLGRAFRRRG